MAGSESRGRAQEKIFGCSDRGHEVCERRASAGRGQVVADDPLPLEKMRPMERGI